MTNHIPTHMVEKRLKCQRCKKVWNYKGNREYYVCCPNCRTSVSLIKAEVHNEDKEKI